MDGFPNTTVELGHIGEVRIAQEGKWGNEFQEDRLECAKVQRLDSMAPSLELCKLFFTGEAEGG